jgi:DnaK suppressor protein
MMQTYPVVRSRKRFLQCKLNELLKPTPEREGIKVENHADPIDQLTSAAMRELGLHMVGQNSRLVSEVRSALTRINEGTYGLCVSCDDPIAAKRLDAVPWALRCLSCQTRCEDRHVDSDNSLTRRDLYMSDCVLGGANVL